MTEAERTEAAYLFALKLAREGRLPKPGMKDYREQIEKTRAEFAKEREKYLREVDPYKRVGL